jgi:hypothetical protein
MDVEPVKLFERSWKVIQWSPALRRRLCDSNSVAQYDQICYVIVKARQLLQEYIMTILVC